MRRRPRQAISDLRVEPLEARQLLSVGASPDRPTMAPRPDLDDAARMLI